MMQTTLVIFSKMFSLNVVALMLLLPNNSLAAEREIETTVLAKSTQDWGGSVLEHYAEGQPEVTVARVTIPAGMALPLHEHPFMTAGVVLQGIIEVRTDSGKTHIARAGDAVIELVNQLGVGVISSHSDIDFARSWDQPLRRVVKYLARSLSP